MKPADFLSRRERVCREIPEGTVLLFPAPKQRFMSGDVPYLHRSCSYTRYLTGVTERDSILALTRDSEVMYVAPRDPKYELWDGPRLGTEKNVSQWLGIPLKSTQDFLPALSKDIRDGTVRNVVIDEKEHSDLADDILKTAHEAGNPNLHIEKHQVPTSFVDVHRLIKDEKELVHLRTACTAVSLSLNDAMAQYKGDVYERDISAMLSYSMFRRGGERLAFPNVVAGGPNATILHYMANSQRINSGEMVMVDAGCEVHGYCSDVSRSWPVSGKFSAPQRLLYEAVLSVQKRAIDMFCVPNKNSLDDMHVWTVHELTYALLNLGFMPGKSFSECVETGLYAKYYPHATGHYLGMDVHDTHRVPKNIPLKSGMVVTVEPGLYVSPGDPDAPEEFWGIGMRIEDDVVISDSGPDILSVSAVKEVDDVENIVGSAPVKWTPR